ncbi:MAG TPA: peptide chain release factor N(5)-glutamine methyltransferase [Candidatus Saccharicenans sp.]|nr:peptide chain release factor N(5)-glutamine methyltransferase [Candidatus Saccharicenans sp.]HUM78901.1 peptide chain release factor N(5)-glutamine methyltransferase [Candidatus Saccharicenans sp.]
MDQLFREAAVRLSASTCPFLEARLLIQAAGQMDEAEFFTRLSEPVWPQLEKSLERLVRQRLDGCPVAYLLGYKEFWGLPFRVNRSVLIPRPETELVVEKILTLPLSPEPLILDIGTGSGNIAVSLAKELPLARIMATDISKRALRLAAENARLNQVDNVRFILSNLFKAFEQSQMSFDLIVSNPPYVAQDDWQKLDRSVRDFEPKKALLAGQDGLRFIRRLVRKASQFLQPAGFLVMEIGAGQAEEVVRLLETGWSHVEIDNDYAGFPRVVSAQRKSDLA